MAEELTFHEKIIAIQNEVDVPKNQYSEYGDYWFRSCEDILVTIKPLLDKYHLLQTINDEVIVVQDRFYVKSTVTVTDGDKDIKTTGFAREMLQRKKMLDEQLTGSASSFARKKALEGIWLIDDAKDGDTKDEEDKRKLSPDDEDRWNIAIQNVIEGKITFEKIDALYEVDILKLREDVAKVEKKIEENG
jgi:hypothetical protein